MRHAHIRRQSPEVHDAAGFRRRQFEKARERAKVPNGSLGADFFFKIGGHIGRQIRFPIACSGDFCDARQRSIQQNILKSGRLILRKGERIQMEHGDASGK